MRVDQSPGDSQSQTTAPCACPISLPEAIKDVGQVFGRDARPIILHHDLYLIWMLDGKDDDLAVICIPSGTCRVSQRIRDQVGNDLAHSLGVDV